ncbi:hypothetical protein [Limosilactobacillus reuteri]|nr:hypothetical protein [Limosilactobacillus reuteri]
MIDLDNKFAIVSDGEVLNLVQKDGKMLKKRYSIRSKMVVSDVWPSY